MLIIDGAVSNLYPGAKMGILSMRGVDAAAPLPPSIIADAMEAIRRKYGRLDRIELKALQPIRAYVDYYRKFGYSYHVLAQLESVLSGKKQINAATGLLQAMFLTELESMLLTAGHDPDRLQTPLRLCAASGSEAFRSISGRDVQTVKDDLMVCSGDAVISSILRGPDFSSRLTAASAGALFTVYAPPGIEGACIETMLQTLEDRIRSFSPAASTQTLRVFGD